MTHHAELSDEEFEQAFEEANPGFKFPAKISSPDTSPRPPGVIAGGSNLAGEVSGPFPDDTHEGFLQWSHASTLRCVRIGLTPAQILVVQVLASLPQETEDVVWIALSTLALRLYGETSKSKLNATQVLVRSLEDGGYIWSERANAKQAKRYHLKVLREWMASVDVTDVFKNARPPVPVPSQFRQAPGPRAKKVVEPKQTKAARKAA